MKNNILDTTFGGKHYLASSVSSRQSVADQIWSRSTLRKYPAGDHFDEDHDDLDDDFEVLDDHDDDLDDDYEDVDDYNGNYANVVLLHSR